MASMSAVRRLEERGQAMPFNEDGSWAIAVGDPGYSAKERKLIEGLEHDLEQHMRKKKPKRYEPDSGILSSPALA